MGLSSGNGNAPTRIPSEQGKSSPIDFHDQLASTWEGHYKSKAFLSRVEAMDEALGERDLHGERWLDAGCGSGTLTRWLAGRGAEATGVDGAPGMVRVAKEMAQSQGYEDSMQFQVANVGALPFADGAFDGVLCSSVLEYADVPEDYLKEIARVTKPGGSLLISVPNAESVVRLGLRIAFTLTNMIGRPRPQYMAHSHHQYSRSQFRALLRAHGYQSDYTAAFGSGMPKWIRGRSWFGRLLVFRADKI